LDSYYYVLAPFINELKDSFKEADSDELPNLLYGNLQLLQAASKKLNELCSAKQLDTILPNWPQMTFFLKKWFPAILNIATNFDMININLTKKLSALIRTICEEFGPTFSETKLRTLLYEIIENASYLEGEDEDSKKLLLQSRSRILPFYVNGYLATRSLKECTDFVKSRHIAISIHELNWQLRDIDVLAFALKILCEDQRYVGPLFEILEKDIVSYAAPQVRGNAMKFLQIIIEAQNPSYPPKKIIPSLTTLSADPDLNVRLASIAGFGGVAGVSSEPDVLETVVSQLQEFLQHPTYEIFMEVLHTFVKVIPVSAPSFRDEFILPSIINLTEKKLNFENEAQKKDMLIVLYEAYHAISCCYISEENLANHLLPALRILHKEMETVEELIKGKMNYRLLVIELIEQMEEKLPEKHKKQVNMDQKEVAELEAQNANFKQFKEKFLPKRNNSSSGQPSAHSPTTATNNTPQTPPKKNWFALNKN